MLEPNIEAWNELGYKLDGKEDNLYKLVGPVSFSSYPIIFADYRKEIPEFTKGYISPFTTPCFKLVDFTEVEQEQINKEISKFGK